MSMKSFDKFCERMILAEPGSEKEIYDERQRLQRTRLALEALVIYSILTALCVLLNENFRFLESTFSGLVFFAGAAFFWWTLRALAKGCLFGVSGKQVMYNSVLVLAEMPIWMMLIAPDDRSPSLIVNGGLSMFSMTTAGFALYGISALITAIVYLRNRKQIQTISDDSK